MVEQLFRKDAGFTEDTSHSVPDAAIITLNADGVLLADSVSVNAECLDERIPVVGRNTAVGYTQCFELFA